MTQTATSDYETGNGVVEPDLQQRMEDDCIYGAIRNGKLMTVTWTELTESEQRQCLVNMFNLC